MKKTYAVIGALVIMFVFFVAGAIVEKTKPGIIPPFVGVSQSPLFKTGTYALQGYRSSEASASDAPDYIGTITIDRVGESYNLEWHIKNGQVQRGVGILTGNVLSVSYVDVVGGIDDIGVASYTLLDDDSLYGPWTSFFSRDVGREYLRWQKY